jgi:2'-5' RNA ligase
MGNALNETRLTYENLWRAAGPAFGRDHFQVDPHLQNKPGDLRRGLTLAFRPGRSVQDSMGAFLRELSAAAPGQYCYRPEELHVTVLAIIPGTESWQDKMLHLAVYKAVIAEVLSRYRRFPITFKGVTASPGAVMIKGFPQDETLARIRDDLRAALQQNGFGEQLDVMYKIGTAHMTVMRFRRAGTDGKRLLALLEANRTADFGVTNVAGLELIFGDWYASAEISRTLQEYPLRSQE